MAPLAAGSYPPITPFQSWVTTSWYSVPLCRLVPFCFSPLPFHSAFFTRVSVSNCVSVPKKREGGRGGGHPCIDADIYAGQPNPLALSKFPTGHSTTPVRGGGLFVLEREGLLIRIGSILLPTWTTSGWRSMLNPWRRICRRKREKKRG